MIVACPMFLQNINNTAMTIALPSIARSLHVPPLHLNLVITAYLLSLAVFLPMSAWLADRFGARQLFCAAIVMFSLASVLCGAATSMQSLLMWRVLQGLGAAMMLPVGRLILLRSVPASHLIDAMVWYTVPPVIGRLAGPLIGGAIVSVTSWHWIFFVNIPFGAVAVLLALLFVEDVRVAAPAPPFDIPGFLLLAAGLAITLGGLDTAGKGIFPGRASGLAIAAGVAILIWYGARSWRHADPVIDLRILRYRTFSTNVLGAVPLRLAIAAIPFLVPLLLQLGFGLSPLTCGFLVVGSAVGALCTRAVMRRAVKRYGFRRLLIGASLLTSVFYTSYALFSPITPHPLIFLAMFGGGLFSSMCMVSLNTFGFVELPAERMSHATALISMVQQLTVTGGVVLAASLLAFFSDWHSAVAVHAMGWNFSASIAAMGLVAMLSLLYFARLGPSDTDQFHGAEKPGDEASQQTVLATEPRL
jgi:EmrB/QacA subfamily drug resistance transporter